MAGAPSVEAELHRLNRAVGARLRVVRKLRGLTQTQLGELLGVSFRQVQKYEGGANRISAASLAHLAAVLGADPGELLVGRRPDGRDLLSLADGFEDLMVRLSDLDDDQRDSVKRVLTAMLDNLVSRPRP